MFVYRISYIVLRIASIFHNTTHRRHISHIATGLCSVFFFLFAAVSSADLVPTAEDINKLAGTARLTTDTFMEESFQLRMGYEYSGKFLMQNDKENLHKLAKRGSDRLLAIANTQKELKQQIEDYQGPDWDDRYGASGLWRKLSAELYTTTSSKCKIDFYLALTANHPQRNEILHQILDQIDSLYQTYPSDNLKLLKAEILAMLALSEPAYKPLAIEQLDSLCKHKVDVPDAIYFRAVIEKIKLAGQTKPNQLNSLAEELARSSCAGDFELILSLAFLRRQLNYPEALEKIVHLWPQTEDFLGSLILPQLSYAIESGQLNKLNLQQISVFEAELAVQAAWKKETQDHKMLLDYFSSTEKFQTPLIVYVAAVAFADSSPAKAVNLLVKASSLQQLQKSDRLGIEACKIAKQAAQLAYNLFVANSLDCELVLKALENYSTIAGERIDEETEYLHSIALNNCGLVSESKKLLEKIANQPTGYWRNRARLDRIIQTIQQGNLHKKQHSALFWRLNGLITNCSQQDERSRRLRIEAIAIYRRLLLELRQLDKPYESVQYLLIVIDSSRCWLAGEVMELLSEIINRIDQLQVQVNGFDKMAQDCKRLAEFCYACLDGPENRQAGLFLAEIATLAAAKKKNELLAVEKLLNNLNGDGDANNIDLLRCRARLLSEQNKFGKAAKLWAKVCKIRRNETPSANQRSWKWWRAKFHELDCCAKIPLTEKEGILHTIEVLENSFADIPPLWAEKLNSLKQEIK